MVKGKYFFKNVTVLNVGLMVIIILMLIYMLFFFDANVDYAISSLGNTSKAQNVTPSGQVTYPSPSDYALIAEANLFHPEREIPPEKQKQQELPRPELVLYGTLISDSISLAYLEDMKAPRKTEGRGRRQIVLRIGDTLSGYTLKNIEIDKVIMERGEDRIIVRVINPQRRKTRESATTPVTTDSQKLPSQMIRNTASTAGQKVTLEQAAKSLIISQPLPKTRAPMTPAEERAKAFFTR
ncbi:MAG: hypothetical protein L6290_00895 [Thermodesulfovibrionales bacterium]|nr:hypothetical protein [Thermodesulfovibrionales bacterium]